MKNQLENKKVGIRNNLDYNSGLSTSASDAIHVNVKRSRAGAQDGVG